MVSFGAHGLAPSLDRFRSTADISPTAAVASKPIKGQDVATFRIDSLESVRLSQPVRAKTVSVVNTTANDSTPIAPPAITA